jgi:uncharacterized protein YgiM (DUF1202 family)
MDRKRRVWFIILVLLFIGLFIFIIRMQSDFVNTDFSAETTLHVESDEPETTSNSDQEDEVDDNDEEENGDQEDEIEDQLPSTMFVIADQLNVRRGPGSDYPIDGMVSHNQEVEVEEVEDDWVRISVDDLTGYVNIDFLAEEVDE